MRKIIPLSVFLTAAVGGLAIAFSTIGATGLSLRADSCDHPAGSVRHYEREEATCTEAGHIEYWVCCECHLSSSDADFTTILDTGSTTGTDYAADDDRYIAPHHTPGDYVVTTEPTVDAEGKATRNCKKCEHVEQYNILSLPKVTYANKAISWEAVEGAEGYKLIDGTKVTDLGDVLTTPLMVNNSDLGVRAYTTDPTYYEYGLAKVEIPAVGANLQYGYVSDFFDEGYVLRSGSGWNEKAPGNGNFYANFDWSIYTESDGNAAQRTMVSAGDVNGLVNTWQGTLKDLGGTNAAGDYQLTFRIKLSAKAAENKATRNVYANVIWDGGFVGVLMENHSLSIYEGERWYECSATFTKPATGWAQLQFFHHTSVPATRSSDDYILIDDIAIHTSNGEGGYNTADVDTVGDGTYQSLANLGTIGNPFTWCLGGTVHAEPTSGNTGTGIIEEEDGNRALKMIGTTECVEITLYGNPMISLAGTYKLKVDLKLGKDSGLKNLGFRGWVGSNPVTQGIPDTNIISDAYHEISTTEYKTFEVEFTTLGTPGGWVNIFFWSFSDSHINTSADNYFLMDNLEIYKIA